MIDVELLRRQSRWFGHATLTLLVLTALVILVPTVVSVIVLVERGERWTELAGWSLLFWSPAIFYLYALWTIRSAFASFAKGGVFGPSIATGCVRGGAGLAIGGTMSAVGVPNLQRIVGLAGIPGRSFGHLGSVLDFDTAYLAVGVIGIALILLGRLLARATELQAEASRLRGELDEIF